MQVSKLIPVLGWLIPGVYLSFAPWIALSNVMLALVLVLFLLTFRSHLVPPAQWPRPMYMLLALYAVVIVGILYTSAPWSGVQLNVGKYSKFVYALALWLMLTGRPMWQSRAMAAFSIGMLYVLAATWVSEWVQLPWLKQKYLGWAVAGDHITQNVMMSFFVVYALTKIEKSALSRFNFFWGAIAVLGAFSVTHLSTGRTGLVLLFAALLVAAGFKFGVSKIKWIALTAACLGALVFSTSESMRSRFSLAWYEWQRADVDVFSNIGHRLYNYKITPELIAESPIYGHGTGAFHTEICRFVSKPEWCATFNWHPHNQFLMFGADHGAIGMLLYAALIASLFWMALRSSHSVARIWLACLTAILLVDSMFNSPMFSSYESHFFLYMLALLVAMNAELAIVRKDQS